MAKLSEICILTKVFIGSDGRMLASYMGFLFWACRLNMRWGWVYRTKTMQTAPNNPSSRSQSNPESGRGGV